MRSPESILTKIVATVGPSTTRQVLPKLVDAGVSVFRLNFSHGTLEEHEHMLRDIRDVEAECGRPLGVMGDLSGPKIRVGRVQEGGVLVEAGQDVVFQEDEVVAIGPRFSSTYPGLISDVEPGQMILVNDGAIRMIVVERIRSSASDEIVCRVTTGGLVSSGKGINLPSTSLSVDAITEKDWQCLDWAIDHELDFVALSFVRRADDILRLRNRITQRLPVDQARRLPIIAKIERPEAIDNIEEILEVTDLIMVARGDLGVEMDLAEVPAIQKRLVDAAQYHGVPCIVATQMLESMISNASPTRAEASDVANAILDGADAVMLSGETSVGQYPILAVDAMARIAHSTEDYIRSQPFGSPEPHKLLRQGHWTAAVAHAAWMVARNVDARVIVAASATGTTAIHLSQNNFRVPVLIVSDRPDVLRRITVLHGIIPIQLPLVQSLDEFTCSVDAVLLKRGVIDSGDPVVLLAGHPIGKPGSTNSLAVHFVGNPETGYRGDD